MNQTPDNSHKKSVINHVNMATSMVDIQAHVDCGKTTLLHPSTKDVSEIDNTNEMRKSIIMKKSPRHMLQSEENLIVHAITTKLQFGNSMVKQNLQKN